MDMREYGQFDLHKTDAVGSAQELQQILQRIEILSKTMVASGVESDPDASLNMFLRGVGEAFEADRAYVFEFNEDGTSDNTFEWCAAGATPQFRSLQHVSNVLIDDWIEAFRIGQGFMIDDMDAYKAANPQAYESLSLQDIDRLVVAPITLEGGLHGFVGVDNPDRNLMQVCMSVFSMAANYIAVMLRHRRNFDYIQTAQNTDVLTGLQSMSSFNSSLEATIRRVASGEETRAWDVLYFNVRGFKEYNINYGFAEGDDLLRRMADVLSIVVDDERVTRYEADHFYALVEDQYAEHVVKQVHNAMSNNSKHHVPVGAGVYHITGKEKSAGQAVDRTKIAGDAAYGDYFEYWRYYDPRMEEEIDLRAYIVSHIDEAIKKGWIEVWYQPIMGSFSGKVAGVEALSRWNDPEHGFLMPDKFIGALENAGLLYKLDLHVIEKACDAITAANAAGRTVVPVSVNLSPHDLRMPDLHRSINAILESHGLSPEMITIEITEGALVDIDGEGIVKKSLRRFHDDGFEVWLDDFGSGYSSLYVLQNFDFDLLKIDMRFMRSTNDNTREILTDIVDMGKRIGMKTLAEGVETHEQNDFLYRIGCSFVQGYLFSEPLPKEQYYARLDEKGYKTQTEADSLFYDALARENVIRSSYSHAYKSAEHDTGSKDPTAINVVDHGKLATIYMNQAYEDWMEFTEVKTIEADNAIVNGRHSANARRVWDCLSRLEEVGDSAYADYVTPGYTWKMQWRMIAKGEDRTAYATTTVNPDQMLMSDGAGDNGDTPITRDSIWSGLMESDAIGIYWKDADRRYLGANRAFLEMYQVHLQDIYGRRFGDIVESPYADELARGERELLENGVRIHDAVFTSYLKGRRRTLMTNSSPIYKDGQIVGLVGDVLDITMDEQEKKFLRDKANRDPLTGLLNRGGFDLVMESFQSDKDLRTAVVVDCGVNSFKSFNDQYGHLIGDSLLQDFAKEAVALVGDTGIVARNGGDEVQMFIKNPDAGWRDHLQRFFDADHHFQAAGSRYTYKVSGGVALYPDMGTNFTELYRAADTALYHAKSQRYVNMAVYDTDMINEPRQQMGFTFADLASGAPAAVLIYRNDEAEGILYANDTCLALFDCASMRELMEHTKGTFKNLVHPDDTDAARRIIAEQQADPANDRYDYVSYRILTKGGEVKRVFDIGRRIDHEYYGEIYYVLLWDFEDLEDKIHDEAAALGAPVEPGVI